LAEKTGKFPEVVVWAQLAYLAEESDEEGLFLVASDSMDLDITGYSQYMQYKLLPLLFYNAYPVYTCHHRPVSPSSPSQR
jgi:hypothetical protein